MRGKTQDRNLKGTSLSFFEKVERTATPGEDVRRQTTGGNCLYRVANSGEKGGECAERQRTEAVQADEAAQWAGSARGEEALD